MNPSCVQLPLATILANNCNFRAKLMTTLSFLAIEMGQHKHEPDR